MSQSFSDITFEQLTLVGKNHYNTLQSSQSVKFYFKTNMSQKIKSLE